MSDQTQASKEAAQNGGARGLFAAFSLMFSLATLLWFAIAALGTRFGLWDWQVGLRQMTIGLGPIILLSAAALSVFAIILALIKSPRKRPFMLALAALLVSGLGLGRVVAFGAEAGRLPPLHDVQTDWSDPIRPTAALLAAREATKALNPILDDPVISPDAEARWPGMAGRRVAEVQEEAEFDPATQKSPRQSPYPSLETLRSPAAPASAFAAAMQAAEARRWEIVTSDPASGIIEATATSFWFGFKDDILIRIQPDGGGCRIDVRSVSRVGLSDLGANAKRVRDLLNELEERIAQGVAG